MCAVCGPGGWKGLITPRSGSYAGVVRVALRLLATGSHRLPKMTAQASSGGGAAGTDQIVGQVRKLPSEVPNGLCRFSLVRLAFFKAPIFQTDPMPARSWPFRFGKDAI